MKLRQNPNKNMVRAANNFKAWDYCFLLELEKESLKSFIKYFEKSKITTDNLIAARNCRIMLRLLEIADGDDNDGYNPGKYCFEELENGGSEMKFLTEATMSKYVNMRNAHRFLKEYDDFATMRKTIREQKAWYLYNKLRYYQLRNCWD